MNCPHCGKDISEFALNCPNCGGNPKESANEEVKEKARKIAKTSNTFENRLSLIGATIAFLFAVLMAHRFMPSGTYIWLISYILVGVALIVIAAISGTIKIAVKNMFFYIASVIWAILDFVLQDRYFNTNFGSNTINLLKTNKGVWFLYNTFKVSHIIIVILGIAFAVALIYRMKQLKHSR